MIDRSKGRQRDRLKSALRENLKRRKAQAKGRAGLSGTGWRSDETQDDSTAAGETGTTTDAKTQEP